MDRIAAAGNASRATVGTRRSRRPVGDGIEDVRLVGERPAHGADGKLLILSVVFVFAFVFKIIHELLVFRHITAAVCLGMAGGVV